MRTERQKGGEAETGKERERPWQIGSPEKKGLEGGEKRMGQGKEEKEGRQKRSRRESLEKGGVGRADRISPATLWGHPGHVLCSLLTKPQHQWRGC